MDRALPYILGLVAALALAGPATAQPAAGYPDLATMRRLIGKDHMSRELQDFRKLVGNRPETSYFDDCFYHIWKAKGLEVRFDAKGAATAIHVFAESADGYKKYTGPLPGRLSISDTRADVERKLGKAAKLGGGWESYPDYSIQISYDTAAAADGAAARIHHITIGAKDN